MNIIPFTIEVKKDKCAFCFEPLIKGKYIQSDVTQPAICFECVLKCNELLKEPE